MSQSIDRTKVSLAALDGQDVPEWVVQAFAREGVLLDIADCASREDLEKHAGDADIVWLFGGSRILQGNLGVLSRCFAVLRTGSGTDNVPVDEATRLGIVVANTPAAFSEAVADHVIALLFATARRIVELDNSLRAGRWEQATAVPLAGIQGQTLGLVGFGHVGQLLAKKLKGFELSVVAYDPYVDPATLAAHGVQAADLETVLSTADIVSLHCPLTPETEHLIGEKEFRLMKPTAILINTSRGPVVEERALVRALTEKRIVAAGLDVFEAEPPATDNPLLKMSNVVVTPHCAGYSTNGVELRWRLSVETVLTLARRRWPPSCVNRTVQPRVSLSR